MQVAKTDEVVSKMCKEDVQSELKKIESIAQTDLNMAYNDMLTVVSSIVMQYMSDKKTTYPTLAVAIKSICTSNDADKNTTKLLIKLSSKLKQIGNNERKPIYDELKQDIRLVETLSDIVFQTVYSRDVNHIQSTDKLYITEKSSKYSYLRIIVSSIDDTYIYGMSADIDATDIKIRYITEKTLTSHPELKEIVEENTQINIINPTFSDTECTAELIIVEPDYLIDISAVANCFENYGVSPFSYLINKLRPKQNTSAILLGNLASYILDEEVHNQDNEVSYHKMINSYFKRNSIPFVTCEDLDDSFHLKAQEQRRNIKQIVNTQLTEKTDIERAIIEPSFFCEMLGLQGRMDLISEDMMMLVEQKSGKKDTFYNKQQYKHYVQVLLYLALLHYNYNVEHNKADCYLLYSKYADGLIKQNYSKQTLKDAIAIRNYIVALEYYYSEHGVSLLKDMTSESINPKGMGGNLWKRYTKPQIEKTLNIIKEADKTAQEYFFTMMKFVQKEHIMAKVGSGNKESTGFAQAWNNTFNEKKQSGNIICNLTIHNTTDHKGESSSEEIESIVLRNCGEDNNDTSNFRLGDVVVLYRYNKSNVPDLRNSIVHRGTITSISTEEVTIKLRNRQTNKNIFLNDTESAWSIEHDFIDSSFGAIYRSLFSFLSTTRKRSNIILGIDCTEFDSKQYIVGNYTKESLDNEHNEIVLRAKQATDYFILIGPPGTGKTSFGMLNILKEELLSKEGNILVTAYTNRAVDEICSKLVENNIDFTRLGLKTACPERYIPFHIEERIEHLSKVDEIRESIAQTRVFVGTTTAVNSHIELFRLKKFSLAIIDEASQILEPQIVGILSATHKDGTEAIKKFVLIGDHKQLPAVCLQNNEQVQIDSKELKDIGFDSCKTSLFERLLRQNKGTRAIYELKKQGRMHPEVAEIANNLFYGSRLEIVPLSHQKRELEKKAYCATKLEDTVCNKRFAFIDCKAEDSCTNNKVNTAEAKLIAEITSCVWNRYKEIGKTFDADTIGIIVPYRNQIEEVKKHIKELGIDALTNITIDTVERYQGSQREVIIYGFTARKKYQLAFLTANTFTEDGVTIDRKLNVALTRAKEQTFLVGDKDLLASNKIFAQIIDKYSA